MSMDFRLNENLLPFSFEDLAHHLFITAMHIAICGIIEIDPEIKGPMKHSRVAAIHHPHDTAVTFKPVLPRVRNSRFGVFSPFPKDDLTLRILGAAIPKRVDEMVLINLLRPIIFESIDPSVKTATIFTYNYYSY